METNVSQSQGGNIGQFTTVDRAKYPRWFIEFMDIANALPEYDKINRSLAAGLGDMSGKRVLDLGSGTGDDARQLVGLLPGVHEIIGVDLSDTMVKEARRRAESADLPLSFVQGDGRRLEYPDGHFDAARAKLVLMHCEDIDATLDDLVRVVCPDGRIAIFDYDFDTMIIDHPNVPVTREVVKRFSDGHRNKWSGRQLFARFNSRGMSNISVEPVTVVMPFPFFENMVSGRLSAARADEGGNAMTEDDERLWWEALRASASKGLFFASFAGFVVAGSTPA